jgi:PEP-CTERM motif
MMSLAQIKSQNIKNGQKRSRFIPALLCALGFSLALTVPAKAAFTGDYALNRFTLMNANADGTVLTPDAGLSIVLTGGNNGSGLPGMTDFVATATGAGLVRFQYSYATLDLPMADFAGYLLGGAFSQLADTDGQSGTAMFTVNSGQSFGFRVGTSDNTSEPGIFTISNFTAPSGAATVPEPGTGLLLLAVAGAALAVQRYRIQLGLGRIA